MAWSSSSTSTVHWCLHKGQLMTYRCTLQHPRHKLYIRLLRASTHEPGLPHLHQSATAVMCGYGCAALGLTVRSSGQDIGSTVPACCHAQIDPHKLFLPSLSPLSPAPPPLLAPLAAAPAEDQWQVNKPVERRSEALSEELNDCFGRFWTWVSCGGPAARMRQLYVNGRLSRCWDEYTRFKNCMIGKLNPDQVVTGGRRSKAGVE